MSIDDVRELVQSRLDDERAVREHRRGNGKDMLPWSNGYVMALQQVLDDMKNFESQDEDDSYEYAHSFRGVDPQVNTRNFCFAMRERHGDTVWRRIKAGEWEKVDD